RLVLLEPRADDEIEVRADRDVAFRRLLGDDLAVEDEPRLALLRVEGQRDVVPRARLQDPALEPLRLRRVRRREPRPELPRTRIDGHREDVRVRDEALEPAPRAVGIDPLLG